MPDGLITEYEWRMQKRRRPRAHPDWWGAQCVYPTRGERLKKDRAFWGFLLLLCSFAALLLPLLFPPAVYEAPNHPGAKTGALRCELPMCFAYEPVVFTRAELLQGKMLLIDEAHPLPQDVLPPNTASIASYGQGEVPTLSPALKTERETIHALAALFAALQNQAADGLTVTAASLTVEEQRQAQLRHLRSVMRTAGPDASARAARLLETPGTGSLLQGYAVEIRLAAAPDQPLAQSPQGQALLQLCWRHGFVQAENPFRFRYVGRAHAAAMTYLNLDFESYLNWMHQQQVLLVYAGGLPQYLILCKPFTREEITFDLPAGAVWEASLDNTGYALVACTLPIQ